MLTFSIVIAEDKRIHNFGRGCEKKGHFTNKCYTTVEWYTCETVCSGHQCNKGVGLHPSPKPPLTNVATNIASTPLLCLTLVVIHAMMEYK